MDNRIKLSENVDFSKVDISIVGKFFAITLPISLDVLKKIERYRPEELQIKNDDGTLKFKVASGNTGSISDYGVTFNDVTRDDRKLAVMTVEMKGDVENAREYIASEHGGAFLNLRNIIARVGEAYDAIMDEMSEVEGYIRFADGFNADGANTNAEGENGDD